MTQSLSPAVLVADAIRDTARHSRIFHKPWKRRHSFGDAAPICTYCLAALDPKDSRGANLDYLVPVSLGGKDISANLVLSCASCARSKGRRDVIAWEKFGSLGDAKHRSSLLEKREAVLLESDNHLTPTYRRAPAKIVLKALRSRFSKPRFTVYAFRGEASSWLGWTDKNGAKDAHALATVLLRYGCEGIPHLADDLSLYEVEPGRFLDAVWALIEHHAIVRPVQPEGLNWERPDPEDWRSYWPMMLDDLNSLRYRHAPKRGSFNKRLPPKVEHGPMAGLHDEAPRKPREQSMSRKAVRAREKRAVLAKQQAWGEYLEARATLIAFKENVRRGIVEAPTLDELEMMEREVLDLLPSRD